jgi:uncharacterized protein involved in exopolysaccharide biosynthesis
MVFGVLSALDLPAKLSFAQIQRLDAKRASERPLIDLFDLSRYYFQQWKTVLIVFFIVAALGAIYYVVTPPVYRAQVTVQFHASAQQNQSLTASLGMALAGLQGERSLPERAEGFGILKSRIFLTKLIEKMNLAPSIYPERYDSAKNQWKVGAKIPTQEQLHRSFVNRVMAVDDNTATGLITVSIFLPGREQTAVVANTLLEDLNERLRQDAIARADENIGYLNKQLESTQISEMRVAIAQLIQSEMKRLLLAASQTTHTFQVIDPAMTPDRLYAPRPLLLSALSVLIAFLVSLFVIVLRFLANNRRK